MTEQGRIAAVGVFDGVHRGHRYLMRQLCDDAAARGMLPVAVTFNNHPLAVVAPERVPSQLTDRDTKRALLIAAGAANVIELDFDRQMRSMTAAQFMAMLHDRYNVRRLLLGFNNRIGHDRVDSAADYAAIGHGVGIEVDLAREYTGIGAPVSSSIIRARLAGGDIRGAVQALGYDYSITGKVVAGKQLGRTIGFPTANVAPALANLQLPGRGVYAARVLTPDGSEHKAMLNIGHRPTVDSEQAPMSIEAHLIDFDGDLYGQTVTVVPVERLRDERRFASVNDLKAQLTADLHTVKSLL